MTIDHKTCFIQLTPPGRSALATVAVIGPQAESCVAKYFRPAAASWPNVNQPAFGHWRASDGEEVVVCLRQADHCEIHCHGGTAAVAAICADLGNFGGHQGDESRWIDTFGRDSVAAAAMRLLPDARTERTAAILLDQFNGSLSREITAIMTDLEEARFAGAIERCESLIATAEIGLHLTIPWRVVIAGRPNVGKSSLFNALIGYQRAITFDQPGTTRDVVSATSAFDGWPVELFDTAGLRAASDKIEATGVALAEQQFSAADVRILVFDSSNLWSDDNQCLLETWTDVVVVHNKHDLAQRDGERPTGFNVSAIHGDGISKLIDEIVGRLVPIEMADARPILITTHQTSCIQAAVDACRVQSRSVAIAALSNALTGVQSNQRIEI